MNQRFWLDKKFTVFNEAGKPTGYNADLYNWWNSYHNETVYNDFVYDEKGKLIAIREEFTEEDENNNGIWEFATDITLKYREDDTINTVDYRFFYWGSYCNRGSGDSTGEIFYDEKERIIYRTYYMTHGFHSCFYLYEGDSKRPWAYIDLGGLASSGDNISEYGFGVSVFLFQPNINEIKN
jgi:hypothetical protein